MSFLAIASLAAPLRARQTGNLGSTTIAFDGIAFPDTANGELVGEFYLFCLHVLTKGDVPSRTQHETRLGTALPTISSSPD
jgi:hypothetical protein